MVAIITTVLEDESTQGFAFEHSSRAIVGTMEESDMMCTLSELEAISAKVAESIKQLLRHFAVASMRSSPDNVT